MNRVDRTVSEEINLIIKHIDYLQKEVERLKELRRKHLLWEGTEPKIDYSEF